MQNFMGLSGYVWWQGVVEDRQDPLELGRARVRILGFHSEDRSEVPTDSLPWAYPAMPINSTPGSIPSVKEGTWVMGFFRDGESAQEPIMTHMIDAGYIKQNKPLEGFNDPETNTFKPSKPVGAESDIGDVNTTKLARGVTEGTLRDDSDIPRIYPYNHVSESESGHILEVNDTPGSESLSVAHRSGSYLEIAPDGDKTTKIVGNDYEFITKNKNVVVDKNMNVSVDGSVIEDVSGNKTENTTSLTVNSTDEVVLNSDFVKLNAPTVTIEGNLQVNGVIKVGGTTVSGRNVTADTFSATIGQGAAVGSPSGVVPVVLNDVVTLGMSTGVNTAMSGVNESIEQLSALIGTIRSFESEIQTLEDDLERWSDLESELTTRLEGLRSKYGIE